MKKYIFIVVISLFIIFPASLNAESFSIDDELGYSYSNGDDLCSNITYSLTAESDNVEIMILDGTSKQIMEVYNSNSGVASVTFPSDIDDVDIVLTDFNTDGSLNLDSQVSQSYSISDCGYTADKAEYTKNPVQASFSLTDTTLTVTAPEGVSDYVMDYQFLNDRNATEVKFENNTATIDLEDNDIIQFTETYGGKTYYYELEINPSKGTFYIREVKSFVLKTIDAKSLIDLKALAILIITIVIFIIIKVKHVKERRKYNKMKLAEKKRRQRTSDNE